MDSINNAYFKLTNNRFDFGKISRRKNPNIFIEVEFTNIGTKPLLLLKADVSCGCLSVDYPKEPVFPNQTGKLAINIDTGMQEGIFSKTVFIKTNAHNDVELIRVIGTVKKIILFTKASVYEKDYHPHIRKYRINPGFMPKR